MAEGAPGPRSGVSRRAFIQGAVGAALGVGAGASFHYPEPKPLSSRRPVNPRQRVAIVYDRHIGAWPEALWGGLGGVGVAAAGGAVLPSSTGRRAFLKAIGGGGLLAWGAANARYAAAIHSDTAAQLRGLLDDLKQSGYHVVLTSRSGDFESALQAASRSRSRDARTIVLVNAHGAEDYRGSYLEGEPALYLKWVSELVQGIPGHALVASNSCKFDAAPFVKKRRSGANPPSLLLLNNGNPEHVAWMGLPFFSAIRHGLRSQNVVKGTLDASVALSKDQTLVHQLLSDFNLKSKGHPVFHL